MALGGSSQAAEPMQRWRVRSATRGLHAPAESAGTPGQRNRFPGWPGRRLGPRPRGRPAVQELHIPHQGIGLALPGSPAAGLVIALEDGSLGTTSGPSPAPVTVIALIGATMETGDDVLSRTTAGAPALGPPHGCHPSTTTGWVHKGPRMQPLPLAPQAPRDQAHHWIGKDYRRAVVARRLLTLDPVITAQRRTPAGVWSTQPTPCLLRA